MTHTSDWGPIFEPWQFGSKASAYCYPMPPPQKPKIVTKGTCELPREGGKREKS